MIEVVRWKRARSHDDRNWKALCTGCRTREVQLAVARSADARRGVVSDFPPLVGTGARGSAHDSPELGFCDDDHGR